MKALTWHGVHDERMDTVADPAIQQATDVIIRVTSCGICGSDLHLYEVLGAFIDPGDVLGHEPIGTSKRETVVEEIMPLLSGDDDPLGVDDFASHHLPLSEAPHAYEIFQKRKTAPSRSCCSRSSTARSPGA